MSFFLNKKILTALTAIVVAFSFATAVLAVWDGDFYSPGETLDPECTPDQPNCDVLIDAGHDAVTLGSANGLSLDGQELSLALASTSTTGALSDTDWDTFNNKQDALVSGTSIKTINSTSLLGSGNISVAAALGSDDNYVTDAQLVVIGNTSGTNSGDNATNSLYSGLATSKQDALSGTGFVKITGTTISYDNSTYLTSLSGAVLTDQSTPQTIGLTGARLAKLWSTDITTTDLTVTNTITGSISGNAATVTTNANLTGPITSVGNATSVAAQTGTGTTFVMQASPTLTTPNIGAATGSSLTLTASATSATPLTVSRFSGSQTAPLILVSEQNALPVIATGTGASNGAIVWETGNKWAFTNGNYTQVISIRAGDSSFGNVTGAAFSINSGGFLTYINELASVNALSPSSYRPIGASDLILYSTSQNTKDTGLTRGAAGRVKATDGSTGYGTFDASDYLVSGAASTGTGGVVRATSPTLVTPVLGAATATTINGLTYGLGAGTSSEVHGTSASTSTANNSLAIGYSASVGALAHRSIALGNGATVTAGGLDAVVIGYNASGAAGDATFGNESVIIGSGATDNGSTSHRNVVIGAGASAAAGAAHQIVIGYNNDATSAYSVKIVSGVSASVAVGNGTATGNLAVSVGNGAASGDQSVSLGSATASGSDSFAMGYAASTAGFASSMAFGRAAVNTAANQLLFGGPTYGISSAYFGEGVTDASPVSFTLNATGGSGTNIAGGALTLAGGIGTGSATPAVVNIATTTAGSSGTSAQTLTNRLTVSDSATTLAGNLLFTDNTYDIGASGATRPRTGYFGTSLVAPSITASTAAGRLTFNTGGMYIEDRNVHAASTIFFDNTLATTAYFTSTGLLSGLSNGTQTFYAKDQLMPGRDTDYTIQHNTRFSDAATQAILVIGQAALPSASTNITGGNVSLTSGAGASSSAGAAHGGNILIDGGVGYGTGHTGYILLGTTNAGNVGVGQSSPGGILDVLTPTSTDTNQPRFYTGSSSSGTWNEILFGAALANYRSGILRYINGQGTAANSLVQLFNAGDTPALGLNIVGGGNVGIGTITPLSGTSTGGLDVVSSNTNAAGFQLSNTSSGGHAWLFESTGSGHGASAGKLLLYDVTASGSPIRLAIDTSGNVGVGANNSSPNDIFSVLLNVNSTGGINVKNTNTSSAAYSTVYLGNNTNANDTVLFNVGTGNSSYGGARSGGVGNNSNTPFVIITNSTEKVRIGAGGTVGIGTTSTDRALEINQASGNNLRLTYNDADGSAANYADFLVSSGGDLSITPSGGDATFTGKFGIGAAPGFPLSVVGSTDDVQVEIKSTATGGRDWLLAASGTGNGAVGAAFYLYDVGAGAYRLAVDSGGFMGLSCNDPDHIFEIGGTGSGCNTGTGSYINAGDTAFTANSSREWKENIETYDVPDILDRITATPARTFDWKPEYCSGADCENHLGFIAQEFYGVLERGDGLHVNGQDIMMAEWLAIQHINLNLNAITGTITPLEGSESESFSASFFENLFEKVGAWLASATNGIAKIFSDEVETKNLCVADDTGEKTCITKAELDALLEATAVNAQGGNGGGNGGNSKPEPEPMPNEEPAPLPENQPEVTEEPDPEITPETSLEVIEESEPTPETQEETLETTSEPTP